MLRRRRRHVDVPVFDQCLQCLQCYRRCEVTEYCTGCVWRCTPSASSAVDDACRLPAAPSLHPVTRPRGWDGLGWGEGTVVPGSSGNSAFMFQRRQLLLPSTINIPCNNVPSPATHCWPTVNRSCMITCLSRLRMAQLDIDIRTHAVRHIPTFCQKWLIISSQHYSLTNG